MEEDWGSAERERDCLVLVPAVEFLLLLALLLAGRWSRLGVLLALGASARLRVLAMSKVHSIPRLAHWGHVACPVHLRLLVRQKSHACDTRFRFFFFEVLVVVVVVVFVGTSVGD